MEHSRDPSFPNQKTLFNRLGPKSQQAQAILSFCERTAGFDDVAALCRPFAGGTTDTDDEPLQRDDGPFGFVYLMRSGKFYKVGRSNSAERRACMVQLALPEELVLVHKIKTDDPSGIEAYWHARFASRRLGANGSTSGRRVSPRSDAASSCKTRARVTGSGSSPARLARREDHPATRTCGAAGEL